MILIADSGSTKTEWCFVEHKQPIKQVITGGINPFHQSSVEINTIITDELKPQLDLFDISHVFFYGAGCALPQKQQELKNCVTAHFTNINVEIGSDLLAACRALCKHKAGIACIMGTGSNSAFWDGAQIVQNISPLGYILGDEGSGAVLGKLLLADMLKNQQPLQLQTKFFQQFGLDTATALEQVYRKPLANRFLAGLSVFCAENICEPSIYKLVNNSFNDFFTRNVMQYNYRSYPVHFTGSVAYHYQDVLKEVACSLGITIGQIYQSPMQGLIEYHAG